VERRGEHEILLCMWIGHEKKMIQAHEKPIKPNPHSTLLIPFLLSTTTKKTYNSSSTQLLLFHPSIFILFHSLIP
jgi:hypothetical protein